MRTLKGDENFSIDIKNGFRKVLSSFAATIERIIQEKNNLPEETIAELKRNQLRAIISGMCNRCFIRDQLQ